MVAEFDPGSVTDPESADPDLDHVIANESIDIDLHRHIDVAHHLPTNASADLDPKNDPLPVLHNLANFSSSHFFDENRTCECCFVVSVLSTIKSCHKVRLQD